MSAELPDLKTLVSGDGAKARFERYHDGNLWYKVVYPTPPPTKGLLYFEFPVPISDIGNATFLAEDKAILFMRYIRKHLQLLRQAKEEST